MKHSGIGISGSVVLLATSIALHGPQAPAAGQANANAGRGGQAVVMGPVKTARYQAIYVQLGSGRVDGVLYEPTTPGANSKVAVIFSNPLNLGFTLPATELASRGYRVLFVTHHGQGNEPESPLTGFDETSRGINYLRTLAGVERVVIISWGAGGVSMTLYTDVAEHGPSACQQPEVLYPCNAAQATGLAKPDGLILLDPGLGAGSQINDLDPAYDGAARSKLDLDMYSAANGYDSGTGTARYSADFRKRYYAGQSARNNQIVDDAVARLKLIEQGNGKYPGDEPLIIPGTRYVGSAASLHDTDLSILSHTKRPHTLLKADGSKPEVVVQSVRPAMSGVKSVGRMGQCCNYTVRRIVENYLIRTTKDFGLTDDDIIGVDWKSSNTGTPGHAEGVTLPTLVMAMTCWEFVVPAEVVYDHLATQDKTLVGVEGAEHSFTPCAAQYGDPKQRMFDYIGGWLAKPGRF